MGYSRRAAEASERGNHKEAIKILSEGIDFYSKRLLEAIGGGIDEGDMAIVLALMESTAKALRESLPWQLVSGAEAIKPMFSVISVKMPAVKKEDDEK